MCCIAKGGWAGNGNEYVISIAQILLWIVNALFLLVIWTD